MFYPRSRNITFYFKMKKKKISRLRMLKRFSAIVSGRAKIHSQLF